MLTTPAKETTLLVDGPRGTDDMDADQQFRTVKKRSPARAALFVFESIVVLIGYVYLLLLHSQRERQESGLAARSHLLVVYGIVYMLRLIVMALWLLPREISAEELTVVLLIWVPMIFVSFALLTVDDEITVAWAIVSVGLYAVGSFVNTYSELQRKQWKQLPENKGRCYTGGLFSLSRNVNYFGDVLLFAGWAAATESLWNAWVPVVMALSFYYYHIPGKEKYLAMRYKRDWPQYVAVTKSFVPYVC